MAIYKTSYGRYLFCTEVRPGGVRFSVNDPPHGPGIQYEFKAFIFYSLETLVYIIYLDLTFHFIFYSVLVSAYKFYFYYLITTVMFSSLRVTE